MTSESIAAQAIRDTYAQSDESLSRYVDILASRGIEWGLLGPREGDKLWQRHVANSLALVDAIPHGVLVADVGSGAGLPGIPVAIARPDLTVTLIEPLLRRVTFLEEAVDELSLGERVSVLRARAEEVREEFDVVICRAVAPLEKLMKWTTPLLASGGQLLALKGSSAEDEVRGAAHLLKREGLRAEILELRAAQGVEGTRAIRVSR